MNNDYAGLAWDHPNNTLRLTLQAIKALKAAEGVSPSLIEIASATMDNVPATMYRLKKLRKLGYITYEDGKPRTIRLTEGTP